MDALWAAAEKLDEWIQEWDRAADAAMLEPGAPNLPEIPAPRTAWNGCE